MSDELYDLHAELDLEAFEEDLSTPYLEYDSSNYHGLYFRIEEGSPLITVYRSGIHYQRVFKLRRA